jgi:gamma-glutamylputrescine oxidase
MLFDGVQSLAQAPSWYEATAGARVAREALRGEVDCDVVVVGGGYTGLSAAIDLADKGYKVVVLDAGRVGDGASGRNGGQICSGYNPSMAKIARWVGRDTAQHFWDMAEESIALLRHRVHTHAIDCDLRWGYLLTALKDRQADDLRAQLDEMERYGLSGARMIDRDEIGTWVKTDKYVAGLYEPTSGHLHPLNYCLGLARVAEAAGVVIYEHSAASSVQPLGPRPVAVTAEGTVRARYMILAGNATFTLVPEMRTRIMPVGTYIVATEPMAPERCDALIKDHVAVADINFVLSYYRQSPDHRMLFGGRVSYSGRDAPNLRAGMRRTMLGVFPELADLAIEYCWGGWVDISMNRFPHFGRLGPNTFFAQGFSGHGVALTGLAGRLMAEAVSGMAERFDLFDKVKHRPFPGGALRTPALVAAMAWFRLRDLLP